MHYHAELLLPPHAANDLEVAVEKAMAPYSENNEGGYRSFWDWYQIGGRWSGEHEKAKVPKEVFDAFFAWLKEGGVTVSGLQFGKQELSPASQIPMVDAKWQEMTGQTGACPVFAHSGQNRVGCDVCRVDELAPEATAHTVMIVYDKDDFQARELYHQEFYTGASIQNAQWRGSIAELVDKFEVPGDWLAVTVDYHS